MTFRKMFLRDAAGSPEREERSILPARVANHNAGFDFISVCYSCYVCYNQVEAATSLGFELSVKRI